MRALKMAVFAPQGGHGPGRFRAARLLHRQNHQAAPVVPRPGTFLRPEPRISESTGMICQRKYPEGRIPIRESLVRFLPTSEYVIN